MEYVRVLKLPIYMQKTLYYTQKVIKGSLAI